MILVYHLSKIHNSEQLITMQKIFMLLKNLQKLTMN